MIYTADTTTDNEVCELCFQFTKILGATMIFARKVDSKLIVTFDDVILLAQSPAYMQLCWISIIGSVKDRIRCRRLPNLPPQLTALNLQWIEVRELPRLPATLVTLSTKSCRIESWPNTRHYTNLETIMLFDNYIERLNKHMSHFVMTIDLSFNKLERIDCDKLSMHLANLNVSLNHMKSVPPFEQRYTINASKNDFRVRHYVTNIIHQRANGNK